MGRSSLTLWLWPSAVCGRQCGRRCDSPITLFEVTPFQFTSTGWDASISDIATGVPWCQDSSERTYSPMILTNTRFRRRPSRLTGQPFRLALKDLIPGAEIEPAVGHRHHDFTAHDLPLLMRISGPVRLGQASSPVQLCDRPVGRQWLTGACGASLSSHTS
jgi:hypothetical protein